MTNTCSNSLSFNKLLFLFLIFITSTELATANIQAQEMLKKGDSLFSAKKYTEAYKSYESLWQQNLYSPQMLLKMAYVKEASKDHTKALYFLNLYYHYQPTMNTLSKMQELADTHDLSGYAFDDYEYFVSVYYRFYNEIAIGGIVLGLLGLGFLFWQKKRGGELRAPSILLGLFLVIFLFLFNYGFSLEKGIVLNDQVYVMSAPSPGANKLTTLQAGHRVKVIEKSDIWYKVEWADKEAFIRENNLLVIQ